MRVRGHLEHGVGDSGQNVADLHRLVALDRAAHPAPARRVALELRSPDHLEDHRDQLDDGRRGRVAIGRALNAFGARHHDLARVGQRRRGVEDGVAQHVDVPHAGREVLRQFGRQQTLRDPINGIE